MRTILLLTVLIIFCYSCSKEDESIPAATTPTTQQNNQPTLAPLQIPQLFSTINAPVIPSNNPQTVEGIALGRKLFYDPILSGDGTQACADCHAPEFAFTDSSQFSTGITLQQGTRNSMPIFNLAWNWFSGFFWHGNAASLEEQALSPVVNPIEMNNTWQNAVANLQADPNYPALFNSAFGTSTIDSNLVTMAIAQFERTLISSNSRFDQYLLSQINLTPQELSGFNIYMAPSGGNCFHCHKNSSNPLWTDNAFHNNGLDATFTDLGVGGVTGAPQDMGKFRTPSLRNLSYTAPYMHDGRFATLDEVIEHYSSGVVSSATLDFMMQPGGVGLTISEKADLKAFLLTLDDPGFIANPAFQDPNP